MRKNINTFISGIMAGIAIVLGGTVFLSVDNKIIGAVAFTVGLFCVCTMGFSLFFSVVVFIFCGFEHCIANMFYFSVAGAWSARTPPAAGGNLNIFVRNTLGHL